MREAVVLENGYIVYLDTITNHSFYSADVPIVFNRKGRVRIFTKDSTTFIALYDSVSGKFKYYAKAKEFWQNAIPAKKNTFYADTNYSELGSNVFKADNVPFHLDPLEIYGSDVSIGKGVDNGTTVILIKENIRYESNIGYYTVEKRSFKFNDKNSCKENGHNVSGNLCSNQNFDTGIQNLEGYKEETFLKLSIDSEEYINHYRSRVADKKYKNEVTGVFYFDFQEHAPIIEDISYIFYKILKNDKLINYLKSPEIDLFQLFEKHFSNTNYQDTNSILPGNAQKNYHKLYTERYFNLLYIRLIEFFNWAYGVQINFYALEKMDVRIRVLSLFTEDEISQLSYNYKIMLLEDILKSELAINGRWSIYNGTNLTEEELIVKIIRSFYRENEYGNPIYDEINKFLDYLISKPKYDVNISKTLFEVLYDKIGDAIFFGDDQIGAQGKYIQAVYELWTQSKYNPNHELPLVAANALKLFTYTPYQAISTPEGGALAAPRIINYESNKLPLLGYIDNYDFKFNNDGGLHKIISVEKTPGLAGSDAIRGYYDIYQPVTIKQTNADDTIVSVPKDNGATPIFYLMYVDSKGDYADMKTSLGSALDIALSFLGVGEYKSISYLTKASEFRKYLAGGMEAAEEVAFIAKVAKGFAAAQAVLGAAHFIFNFATNNCEIFKVKNATEPTEGDPKYPAYNLCKKIDHWLFVVEMLTFSADFLAQRALKRATRELRAAIPDGSEYNGVRNVINGIDDVIEEYNQFKQFLLQNNYNKVYAKVEAFTKEEDKFAFMFDFQKYPSSLNELNLEDDLIDVWKNINNSVKPYRKLVKVLKARKFLSSAINHKFNIHIFEGEVKFFSTNMTTGGFHHIFGEGVTQNSYGKIVNVLSTDYRGYAKTHAEIFHNSSFYKKGNYRNNVFQGYINNDMFRQDWTKEELLDNIALAYTTKYFVSGNKYIGQMSDSKLITICVKDGNNNMNVDFINEIITAWPNN